MFTEFLFYFQFLRFVVCRVLLYPLRLKLLYEAKAKGLQAALLGEPKGSFVADRCFFRIGVATNAIIAFSDLKVPRWPPNLGGQSLKGILYRTHV